MIPFSEIQSQALALGWDDVGVTSATIPEADITAYHSWLEKGYQGDLKLYGKSDALRSRAVAARS